MDDPKYSQLEITLKVLEAANHTWVRGDELYKVNTVWGRLLPSNSRRLREWTEAGGNKFDDRIERDPTRTVAYYRLRLTPEERATQDRLFDLRPTSTDNSVRTRGYI